MRRSTDFTAVVRRGRRAREQRLVLHLLAADRPLEDTARPVGHSVKASHPLVGLIVGRNVGPSVIRHRVSRCLRAQVAERLEQLPAGSRAVIRGLPTAAGATSAQLAADLDRALASVSRRRVKAGSPR